MRPRRLDAFDYLGPHRYFLTWCTHTRREIFVDEEAATVSIKEFLRTTEQCGFAVIAYCFMPDHVHALVEGVRDDADFRAFAKLARQRIAIALKKIVGGRVWQDGYYEHVLRDEEATAEVAVYILENPVRKGLVAHPLEYKFSGSTLGDLRELTTTVAWRPF